MKIKDVRELITEGQVLYNKDLVELLANDKVKARFNKNKKLDSRDKEKLLEELYCNCEYTKGKDGRSPIYIVGKIRDELLVKEHGLTGKVGNKKGKFGSQEYSIGRLYQCKIMTVIMANTDLSMLDFYYLFDYSSPKDYVEELGLPVLFLTGSDNEGYITKRKLAENNLGIIIEDTNKLDEREYQYFSNAFDSLVKQGYLSLEYKYVARLIKDPYWDYEKREYVYDEHRTCFVDVEEGTYNKYKKVRDRTFNELGYKAKYFNLIEFYKRATEEEKKIMATSIRSQLKGVYQYTKGYRIDFVYETFKINVTKPVDIEMTYDILDKLIKEQLFVNEHGQYLPFNNRKYYCSQIYKIGAYLDNKGKKQYLKDNMDKYFYGDDTYDEIMKPMIIEEIGD